MGCAHSNFLDDDGESVRIVGPSSIGHHIVSLTSSTYGLLTSFDRQPNNIDINTTPNPSQHQQYQPPEVINWELTAADLDNKPSYPLHSFKPLCPPGGQHTVILYITTLRGIRKTFEDCCAVRSVLEGTGVVFKERDVSMDVGFREELKGLLEGGRYAYNVPQLFVKGRHVGGVEAVMRIHEEGELAGMLEGLPKNVGPRGGVCDGCGGVGFLPCFRCCGSRKVVDAGGDKLGKEGKVVRCGECNENGLVLCPICC